MIGSVCRLADGLHLGPDCLAIAEVLLQASSFLLAQFNRCFEHLPLLLAKLNPGFDVGQQVFLIVAGEGCSPAVAFAADQLGKAIGEAALDDLPVHLVADVQLADLLAAHNLHEDGAVPSSSATLLQIVDHPLPVLVLGQGVAIHKLRLQHCEFSLNLEHAFLVIGLVHEVPGGVEEGIGGLVVELSSDGVDALHADCAGLLQLHRHHLLVVLEAVQHLGLEGFVAVEVVQLEEVGALRPSPYHFFDCLKAQADVHHVFVFVQMPSDHLRLQLSVCHKVLDGAEVLLCLFEVALDYSSLPFCRPSLGVPQ